MGKIVKVIPLYNDTATTTTSTSYVAPTSAPFVYWDNDVYDGTVAVYFEAVISTTSGGTAYAQLYTTGGSAVTGSEVSYSADTSVSRQRSGDIKANLSDNTEYYFRLKASSGATTTLHTARLVVVQTGGITKTETQIPLVGQLTSTTSTKYVDHTYTYYFYFDQDRFDGSTSMYFEANGRKSGGYNCVVSITQTDNTTVTNGSITFSSTSGSRYRVASTMTLTNGTEYKIRIRTTGAFGTQAYCWDARIILQQSGFTKTETHYPIRTTQLTDTTVAGSNSNGYFYWDNDEWSVAYRAVYHEATMLINTAGKTAFLDLNDGSSDLSNATISTGSTSKVRVRSSAAIILSDNTTYDNQLRIDATTATATAVGGRLIIHNHLMNASNFGTNF